MNLQKTSKQQAASSKQQLLRNVSGLAFRGFYVLFAAFCLVVVFVFAGAPLVLAEDGVEDAVEAKKSTIRQQLPTTQRGVKNAAQSAEVLTAERLRRVQGELTLSQKRALLLLQDHDRALRAQPDAQLRARAFQDAQLKARSDEFPDFEKDIARLNDDYQSAQKNPTNAAVSALTKALQPFGKFLQDAREIPCDLSLSPDELALHRTLSAEEKSPSSVPAADSQPLLLLSPDMLYALHHIPVTISVRAPVGSAIYFQAMGGGLFSNHLNIAKVITPDNGIASITWMSKGDSVGNGEITITSPTCPNSLYVNTHVVSLVPKLPF